MKTVVLKRLVEKHNGTWGIITILEDNKSFVTMERLWNDNKSMTSCIPAGTYIVSQTMSPRFKKLMYLVNNVPNRAGIRLHSANWPMQLNGCISLGTAFADTPRNRMLTFSRIAHENFNQLLANKPFKLVIKNIGDA